LRLVRRLTTGTLGELPDARLLERFVAGRDQAAFAALVRRHGPVVLGVCQRALGDAPDADDVFQTTFLVLARKAASLGRPALVGNWLYGVAYRTAVRARSEAARRRGRERPLVEVPITDSEAEVVWRDLRPVLDDELSRLPAKYRLPLVLCYLEGRTAGEAARLLGCPRGTVLSRLARGRECLRPRLIRRGLALSTGPLATLLFETPLTAAVPPSLIEAAIQAPRLATAAGTSARAAWLANGIGRAIGETKLRIAAGLVLVLGVLGAGTGLFAQRGPRDKSEAPTVPELIPGRGPSLRLPPPLPNRLGLQIGTARAREAPPRVLELPATLAVDGDRLLHVSSRFSGEVIEVGRFKVGDAVKKGELLAVIWSKALGEKAGELLDALVQLHSDQESLTKMEKLYEQGSVPEAMVRQCQRTVESDRNTVNRAERTLRVWRVTDNEIKVIQDEAKRVEKSGGKRDPEREKNLARVEIRAPLTGTLLERNLVVGEIVDTSTELFKIGDLSRLKVLGKVSEEDLPALQRLKKPVEWTIHPPVEAKSRRTDARIEGSLDQVRVREEAWNARFKSVVSQYAQAEQKSGRSRIDQWQLAFGFPIPTGQTGRMEAIGPVIDPATQTATVTGWVDNTSGTLRPGQLVTVAITLPPDSGEVEVPVAALVEEGGATYVFVQTDAARPVYESRRVMVVRRGKDVAHVRTDGLRPGERIVTPGAVELKGLLEDLKAREKR
jgi:cobalt-zinc-cadmium efflux system membrane fusion protein